MALITDKEQQERGKTVQFGLAQINNPTPLTAKYIFRIIAFLSGVWALLPQDLLGLSSEILAATNKWIIVGNTVVMFAIKFFGWDYKNE